jgi:sugar phosphate isomerase/epimerase
MVSLADRPNAHVLVDTWHFLRGSADYAALAQVPGERISHVQISDASPSHGDLLTEMNNRELPGHGDLDLVRLLRALIANNAVRRLGPEIISPAMGLVRPAEALAKQVTAIDMLLTMAHPYAVNQTEPFAG